MRCAGGVFRRTTNEFATARVHRVCRALNEVTVMAKRPMRSIANKQAGGNPDAFEAPGAAGNQEVVDQAADMRGRANGSDSMASEPAEDEIRMRAYRRYLERGGGDGQDFDD